MSIVAAMAMYNNDKHSYMYTCMESMVARAGNNNNKIGSVGGGEDGSLNLNEVESICGHNSICRCPYTGDPHIGGPLYICTSISGVHLFIYVFRMHVAFQIECKAMRNSWSALGRERMG